MTANDELHISMATVVMGVVSIGVSGMIAVIGYSLKSMITDVKESINELYECKDTLERNLNSLRTDFERLYTEHKMTHKWDGLDRRDEHSKDL